MHAHTCCSFEGCRQETENDADAVSHTSYAVHSPWLLRGLKDVKGLGWPALSCCAHCQATNLQLLVQPAQHQLILCLVENSVEVDWFSQSADWWLGFVEVS